jgi:zinc transport system permease protein
LTLILLYHQLVYIAYDEEAAAIAGVKVRLLNYVFSVLVASAISVTIRIVGVLVISSMIALPVAAALQLGKGFKATLVFSVIFSIIDIILGLILSYYLGVAPGGFTALVSVAVLVLVIIIKTIARQLKIPQKQGVIVP